MKGRPTHAEMRDALQQQPATDAPTESSNEEVFGSESSPTTNSGLVISALAELPERTLVDERALAKALGVSMRTVRRMVGRYELPPPVPFGGRAMWQVGKVLAWFEARADRAARSAQNIARKIGQTE